MPAIPRVDRLKTIYTAAKGLNFGFRLTGYPTAPQYNGWAGRAIPQLHRLTIRFCKQNEASAGVRQWIDKELLEFAKKNPSCAIYVIPGRQCVPTLRGEYANNRIVHVNAKGLILKQVCRHINDLRSRSGEPIVKFVSAQTAECKSMQGEWSPVLWQDSRQNAAYPNLPQPEFSTYRTGKMSATEYILAHSVENPDFDRVESEENRTEVGAN